MVRVYCVCLDGAPPNLMVRLAMDGTLPNLGKLIEGGSWTRAVPSLPTVTSVNWTTIASGHHSGSHGRPRSNHPLRYFWEEAQDNGILVGLANIEHNPVEGDTFFVGHARILADPMNVKIPMRGRSELEIVEPGGKTLAGISVEIGDSVCLEISARETIEIDIPKDILSAEFSFGLADGTRACTSVKYSSTDSRLYVSPTRSVRGFADPGELEERMLEAAGLPPIRGFPLFHHQVADIATALEEEARHASWYGKIAVEMMSGAEDGLWFHRHNTTDGIGHYYLGLLDPSACCYDPGNLEANWRDARRWYQTIDLIYGEILRRDPESRVAICTDHGQVGYKRLVSLSRLLIDNGLAVQAKPMASPGWEKLKALGYGNRPPRRLDRARSKVLVEEDEILVNLETLDPPGPVPEVEYEAVRESVVEALRGLIDPDSGRHVMALALRREDAQSLAYWGKARGDVLFMLEGGYYCPKNIVLEETFADICVPGNSSVPHGFLPGYETEVGSSFSLMAFSAGGAGERNISESGAPHIVDFAPTVLALLGVPVPQDLPGRVQWEMIGSPTLPVEPRTA